MINLLLINVLPTPSNIYYIIQSLFQVHSTSGTVQLYFIHHFNLFYPR